MFTLALHKLPYELLHLISLDIISVSIHSVGLGQGTEWDVGVFITLANISPRFEAVTRELAVSIFGPNKLENRQSNIHNADALMHELRQLSQPGPGGWDVIVTKYPDKYPSDIFKAYSLLNSAISLRRGSLNNPINAFIVAQEFALKALGKMSSCRIAAVEISSALKLRCFWEKKILTEGINLVRTCDRITSLLAQLPPNLAQLQWQLISQAEPTHYYAELRRLVSTVKGTTINYENACSKAGETENMKALQLPGVAAALRKVYHLL